MNFRLNRKRYMPYAEVYIYKGAKAIDYYKTVGKENIEFDHPCWMELVEFQLKDLNSIEDFYEYNMSIEFKYKDINNSQSTISIGGFKIFSFT